MPNKQPFDFDDSGQFMLAQVYIIGAAMQVDRYQAAINQTNRSKVTSLFVQLHEVSCLFEDLAAISEYFKQGSFTHSMDRTWKQVRHHIRHDIRDKIEDSVSKGMTQKRHKFLQIRQGMKSRLSFQNDTITVGSTTVGIADIKDYIDWANEIMDDYVKQSRVSGKLTSQ